jgi:hypothetical protein
MTLREEIKNLAGITADISDTVILEETEKAIEKLPVETKNKIKEEILARVRYICDKK